MLQSTQSWCPLSPPSLLSFLSPYPSPSHSWDNGSWPPVSHSGQPMECVCSPCGLACEVFTEICTGGGYRTIVICGSGLCLENLFSRLTELTDGLLWNTWGFFFFPPVPGGVFEVLKSLQVGLVVLFINIIYTFVLVLFWLLIPVNESKQTNKQTKIHVF